MDPLVSFVVVNLNGIGRIGKCLEAIQAQSFSDFEVIAVDNGSSDGSAEFIEKNFPSARLIKNKSNLGFCAANNQAIAASKGEFIATVNNDVVLHKDYLRHMLNAAGSDERIGMVSCTRFFSSGKIECVGLELLRGFRLVPTYDASKVFCPDDGACLWRKKMLEEISVSGEIYDNDFFIYHEDCDIGLRARRLGWRCAFAEKAVAVHEGSATTRGMGSMRPFLISRNSLLVIFKNLRAGEFFSRLPFILADFFSELAGNFYFGEGIPFIKGKFSALPLLPKMLKKRKAFFEKVKSAGK
ncbi:MAG: glycosyltransferase family 2 protein [Candidatus Diapherotrites archaeon]